MKPMSIIFIGSVIAIIGGVLSAFGTYKHNKKSSEKTDRIEQGVKKGIEIGESTSSYIADLEKKVGIQMSTIDRLREENNLLHEKLSNKNFEIYNYLTGGNGVTFIKTSSTEKNNEYNLVCYNSSKYPQSKIIVAIIDYSLLMEKGTKDKNNLYTVPREINDKVYSSIELDVIRPYSSYLINKINIQETRYFLILINNAGNSPNSLIKQRIAFVKNQKFNFVCSDAYNSNGTPIYNNFDMLKDKSLKKEAIKHLQSIDLTISLK